MPNENVGNGTFAGAPYENVSDEDKARYARNKANMDEKYSNFRSRPKGPARMIHKRSRPTEPSGGAAILQEPELPPAPEDSGGDSGGSYYKSYYVTPNYEEHVKIALGLSLVIILLAWKYRATYGGTFTRNPLRFLVGGAAVTFTLVIMAHFRGTDKLAAAFAWLIFVTVLLVNGEQAIGAITDVVSPPTGGGGGTGKKK